jgi:hypothetical protein
MSVRSHLRRPHRAEHPLRPPPVLLGIEILEETIVCPLVRYSFTRDDSDGHLDAGGVIGVAHGHAEGRLLACIGLIKRGPSLRYPRIKGLSRSGFARRSDRKPALAI